MNLRTTIVAILAALAITACTNKDNAGRASGEQDSKYSYEYVKKICVTQPDKALTLLKTAEDKHLMPALDINMLRSMVYYNSMLDYKKAIHYAEAALHDPDVENHPDKLQNLLHMASMEYYYAGNYTQCLKKASRALDEAYKNHNRRLVGQLLTTMGQCHSEVGNATHALYSFDRAIVALNSECKKSPTWNNVYELATAHAMKASTLLELKQYNKLFGMKAQYESALKQLNALPEGISGINDQANATFYSLYAIGYEQSGHHAQGRDMYDKLSTTRAFSTPEGATFVTPYLLLQGNYAEALKRTAEMEALWQSSGKDSVDFDYSHNILMFKARALQGLGRYKEAIETGMRAYYLSDSLTRRIKEQNAMWMSEKLGKDFLKKYLVRQDRALKISNITIAAIGTLLFVCLIGILVVIHLNRKLKRKNLAAATLINELLQYKQQLLNTLTPQKDADAETAEAAEAAEQKNKEQEQYEKFLRIEKTIIDRKLFLQPKLERADVAKEIGMGTNQFNALFSMFSSQTFTSFINNLRMEHAAKLLKEKPCYTIEAIANECGVPIRQTFHRLFYKKFGMTPADYRTNLNQANGGGNFCN